MTLDEERFFYRTGRRSSTVLGPATESPLRPALFAQVQDLAALRYDYPVVLVNRPGDPRWIEPLSSLVDVALAEVAPAGSAGERFRRTVLRLEREIRILLRNDAERRQAAGQQDPEALPELEDLWARANERLTIAGGEPVATELARAKQALHARNLLAGVVADCDTHLPAHLVGHAWEWVQARRADQMRQRIATLRVSLDNLVKADYLRSTAGRGPETLAAGVGTAHRELFDFGVMASLLAAPSGGSGLAPARRRRIEDTIAVLQDQPFFGPGALAFRFARVDEALAAWRERQPAMAAVVRAIAIAELEIGGRYNDARHDEYFAGFDFGSVAAEERALFPDYLVTLGVETTDAGGRALLLEALASDAPIKVLLQTGDPYGLGGQLATTAMGMGNVFVIQATSSHLPAVHDQVQAALEFGGPALVSVFDGVFAGADSLPPYLVSAAALESRAFPAFAYDPSAGSGWAERFELLGNPQPDRLWPVHGLRYADANLARVEETVAFTPIDLALCDPARARHFARTPEEHWSGLVPSGDWLDGAFGSGAAPFVPAIDPQGRLLKLAADDTLVREARRVAEAWSRLLQLDEMKRERVVVVEAQVAAPVAPETTQAAAAAPAGATQAAGVQAGAEAASAPAEAAPEPERNPDEPYIETWRCTTCNECTAVNARMFAYNENRQAFIKDVTAGSYRDLVTAAESCQVAIIHPGKPRDPNEPGLDELVERAQPFL